MSHKTAAVITEGDNAPSTRASRQVSPAVAPAAPMASSEPTTARRSTRKVKLTVTEPAMNAPGPSSNAAQTSAGLPVAATHQNDLPMSEERSTSVLNQNKSLSGTDGAETVRYKGKNKMIEDASTPLEGYSDSHQVCFLILFVLLYCPRRVLRLR